MNAYLIDVATDEVREVEFSGDYKQIYQLIGADCFDCVRLNEAGDTAYVDDEGLLKNPTHFWQIEGRMFAGSALVLGTDLSTGESVAPKMTLQALQRMVSFRHDLQVDGFKTEEGEEDHPIFGKAWTIRNTPIFSKRESEDKAHE